MIYCFLADGFEELEAIAPIDLLRRAGADLVTVGVTGKTVTGSHKITVTADVTADEIVLDDVEAIILPGGMPGTLNLENDPVVQKAITFCAENGRLICAICAAPSVLGHRALLCGKRAVCYPGFEDSLSGADIPDEYVVRDGSFITAKGAGVAADFGLEIVEALYGKAERDRIFSSVQCRS